jgi:hypothetical protein
MESERPALPHDDRAAPVDVCTAGLSFVRRVAEFPSSKGKGSARVVHEETPALEPHGLDELCRSQILVSPRQRGACREKQSQGAELREVASQMRKKTVQASVGS